MVYVMEPKAVQSPDGQLPHSPEHVGYGVVADVEADAESALEELDSQVLGAAEVKQHAALAAGGDQQGEVDSGQRLQRPQLQVRVVVCEPHAAQPLAVLA